MSRWQTRGAFHRILAGSTSRRPRVIRPAVILRVVSLAVELASEGREGRSVGTMFVVGDSRQVLRCAQQLVLNPFHGYSRALRNVLDPSLAETIKEFAQIDGAFIIQSDGTVLSAGTFLAPQVSGRRRACRPGARHTTAASISSQTRAVAERGEPIDRSGDAVSPRRDRHDARTGTRTRW